MKYKNRKFISKAPIHIIIVQKLVPENQGLLYHLKWYKTSGTHGSKHGPIHRPLPFQAARSSLVKIIKNNKK